MLSELRADMLLHAGRVSPGIDYLPDAQDAADTLGRRYRWAPVSTEPTRIIGFDLPNVMGTVAANDEVHRRRATRVVAAGARDADDCALLLAMIGLSATEGVAHSVD